MTIPPTENFIPATPVGTRLSFFSGEVLSTLTILILVLCGNVADAQQPNKIFRIGFLDSSSAAGVAVLWDVFRHELRRLGWFEEKNIAFEGRYAEQKLERLPELAADLVRHNIDLIVVVGTPAALAAKRATTTIPIVIVSGGNPVGAGLVASLARPGGNITGLSSLGELNTKRLEILQDSVPKLARVGFLWLAGGGIADELQLKDLRPAAEALKLRLEEIETRPDTKGLESAFELAKHKQVNAIMMIPARPFFAERKQIVKLAGKYRVPVIYTEKGFVAEGGLMSYGAEIEDLFRRGAVYVDRILKGANPSDLPVQQATKFEFIINLKAAKQINLTIPPNVLARADRVIR
jgi:putative tryptophan/tyrosine transport system substrate-binding protein